MKLQLLDIYIEKINTQKEHCMRYDYIILFHQ